MKEGQLASEPLLRRGLRRKDNIPGRYDDRQAPRATDERRAQKELQQVDKADLLGDEVGSPFLLTPRLHRPVGFRNRGADIGQGHAITWAIGIDEQKDAAPTIKPFDVIGRASAGSKLLRERFPRQVGEAKHNLLSARWRVRVDRYFLFILHRGVWDFVATSPRVDDLVEVGVVSDQLVEDEARRDLPGIDHMPQRCEIRGFPGPRKAKD